MIVRVVIEHGPNLFAILGLAEEKKCAREIGIEGRTFYRTKSTDRWVLYRGAVSGHGDYSGKTFSPAQR